MNLDNYYLNLEKVFDLPENQSKYIRDTFSDMIHNNFSNPFVSKSLFTTLNENGYLCDIRDKKIEKILEDSNG